jgi:medium-chain acyl-[acyl-carrier-protein] hydrolase
MTETVWTATYDVNTIVLDARKRLGLVGLLNILQDAAWLHASHLGWGYEDLIRYGTIWVLARQKLAMGDWPHWRDVVTIRTWARPTTGALAVREFEIFVGGNKLGECTTSWLILDYQTRRPQKLDRAFHDTLCRKDGHLSIEAQKIAPRAGLAPAASFAVRDSDLDINGHVNNTRYAQWATDSLTPEELETLRIAEYEVNFLAETRVGDIVAVERSALEPNGALLRGQFQGRRAEETKPLFVATIAAAFTL